MCVGERLKERERMGVGNRKFASCAVSIDILDCKTHRMDFQPMADLQAQEG